MQTKELKEIIEELKNKNVKKVLIQIAEGLKPKLKEICDFFASNNIEAIAWVQPTYGACDVRDEEALRFGCEAIIHIAHADFGVKSKVPIYYVHYILEPKELKIDEELYKIKHKKIGIVTSLQYIKYVDIVEKKLKDLGFEVYKAKTLEYEAQILGCNISAAKVIEDKVDAFLVISEGTFYPLALILNTEKPIYFLDLEKQEIKDISFLREKYRKIIAWNYSKFEEAKEVGIVVSSKKGQIFFDPFKVKKTLEKLGKKCYIFAMDEINQENLIGIEVDCLINIACPRIFDDIEKFKIPFINFIDLMKYKKIYEH